MAFSPSRWLNVACLVLLLLFAGAQTSPTFQPPLPGLERRLIIKRRPGSSGDVTATGLQGAGLLTFRAAAAPVLHFRLKPGASMEQALLELNARDGEQAPGLRNPAALGARGAFGAGPAPRWQPSIASSH